MVFSIRKVRNLSDIKFCKCDAEVNGGSVFLFGLDELKGLCGKFKDLLQDSERQTANGYKDSQAKENYIIRHGLLRMILADVTGIKAKDIRLFHGNFERPHLENAPAGKPICFSTSSTGNLYVVAISEIANTEIGVDIEAVGADFNFMDLACAFFHEEETLYLEKMDKNERPSGFIQIWTEKEAYLKASQDFSFKNFAVPVISSTDRVAEKAIGGSFWHFRYLDFGPDIKSTLVYRL